jgi:ribosome biogenesis protein Tsr3
MNKKRLLIIILITLAIIFSIKYILDNKTQEKYYLNDKYYSTNEFIEINSNKIDQYKNDSYILFTYNNYCTLPIPCETIFEEFTKKNNIAIVSIPFENFRKTYLYKEVKYAPSIIVINKGKIVTYLDANSDNDLPKYQNVSEFENWISKYVYLTN